MHSLQTNNQEAIHFCNQALKIMMLTPKQSSKSTKQPYSSTYTPTSKNITSTPLQLLKLTEFKPNLKNKLLPICTPLHANKPSFSYARKPMVSTLRESNRLKKISPKPRISLQTRKWSVHAQRASIHTQTVTPAKSQRNIHQLITPKIVKPCMVTKEETWTRRKFKWVHNAQEINFGNEKW